MRAQKTKVSVALWALWLGKDLRTTNGSFIVHFYHRLNGSSNHVLFNVWLVDRRLVRCTVYEL